MIFSRIKFIKGNNKESMHDCLPRNVASALKEYQKDAIKKGLLHKGCVYIADEMGLGKTLEALCIAYIFKDDWPMLIVCPSSVVFQWRDQILRWFYPSVQKENIAVWEKSTILNKENIVISSYDSVGTIPKLLNFFTIICDECHYLKNYKTKRFKVIYDRLESVKRIILLSGTPISQANLNDIYTQYRLFDK